MIFWFVLKLEVSYRIIRSWKGPSRRVGVILKKTRIYQVILKNIYWSLLECKIRLYLLNLLNYLLFIITKTFSFFFSKKAKAIDGFISFAHLKQQSLIFPQFHCCEVWNNSFWLLFKDFLKIIFLHGEIFEFP
jgi:hypothetical protein